MKRGAERQIQREDGEDPHSVGGDEDRVQSGENNGETRPFASRPIRGLPKKKTGSASASPSPTQTPSPAPFSFTAFGESPASVSLAPAASSPFSFGTFSSSGSASISPASTASFAAAPSPSFSFAKPVENGKSDEAPDSSEVVYYCSLRGLNLSLQSQIAEVIAKVLEKDAFADLTRILKNVQETYEGHRQKEEEKKNSSKTSPALSSSSASITPSKTNMPSIFSPLPASFGNGSTASSSRKEDGLSTSPGLAPTDPTPTASKVSEEKGTKIATSSGSSMPKPPSAGFSFAGSTITSPSSQSSSSPVLLANQPTFLLPSKGFFSSFGKADKDGVADEDDEGKVEDSIAKPGASKTKETPATPAAALPSPGTSQAPASTSTSPFRFGGGSGAIGSSSAPFSFGSAAATKAPFSSNIPAGSNTFRFGFGSNSSDLSSKQTENAEESTSPVSANSTVPPSIGSNFANTTGVKQGGAFSFGFSKINFGSGSPTSGFGSTSNPTAFSFGSTPAQNAPGNDGSNSK